MTGLARISHRLPRETADTLADTASRSVGRLDVLSSTPAAASVALLVCAASRPFREATGEKCGLGLDWFDRHHFKFHGVGFVVDRSFKQHWRVRWNLRSICSGCQKKSFFTRDKVALPAVFPHAAASADLKHQDSDLCFFQGVTDLLGS